MKTRPAVTISLSEEGEARFATAFAALAGDRAELLAYLTTPAAI